MGLVGRGCSLAAGSISLVQLTGYTSLRRLTFLARHVSPNSSVELFRLPIIVSSTWAEEENVRSMSRMERSSSFPATANVVEELIEEDMQSTGAGMETVCGSGT